MLLRPFLVVALLLVLGMPVGQHLQAQQQEAASSDDDQPRIRSTGIAVLDYRDRESSISYALGYRGPLFSLRPIVEVLGGELEIGPLGQGHTLVLGEDRMVVGPDSIVMTVGQEIVPLSQQPMMSSGGLEVPLDFLRKTYGDMLGFRFDWDEGERRLEVSRREGQDLVVDVDWVHTAGITTLLFSFEERPRYRVEQEEDAMVLVFLGDRLTPGEVPANIEDPLIRGLRIDRSRLEIVLADGAAAAAPYELDKEDTFELVVDVSRGLRQLPASTASTAQTPNFLPPRRRGGRMKIVIDPGHGGSEHGTVARSGTAEKDLTLMIARRLRSRLQDRLPVEVVLTRNGDEEVDHETRTALANQHQADLFVSIHLNSEPWSSGARGAETYFLSAEASDSAAATAAAFENQGGANDDALQLILWDLAQNRHLARSQQLAKLIQQELNQALGLPDRGVKQAPFRVLMGATMPAVLVELGFLSNPAEEKKLLDPAYRLQLVDSLVAAIQRFRAPASGSSPGGGE